MRRILTLFALRALIRAVRLLPLVGQPVRYGRQGLYVVVRRSLRG